MVASIHESVSSEMYTRSAKLTFYWKSLKSFLQNNLNTWCTDVLSTFTSRLCVHWLEWKCVLFSGYFKELSPDFVCNVKRIQANQLIFIPLNSLEKLLFSGSFKVNKVKQLKFAVSCGFTPIYWGNH